VTVTVHHGDSRDVLKTLADNSIDSCVTDPPYGISFMGRDWDGEDAAPFDPAFWREVLRVLKPGAHLVAFGGTRSYHRLVCAIEDAGFEIRDQLAWVYGSGFPKSHDVSKGIDKAAGVEFEARPASGVGFMGPDGPGGYNVTKNQLARKGESTDAARQWQGWGTALKPSYEPVCLAQKPYTFEQEWVTIRTLIERLWSALWLTLPVNVAERLSALSPSASGVDVSASAQWAAGQRINTQAVLSGLTDTSLSELALITSLSTVSSWNDTLAASCRTASTSITATGSSATTDLRTLRSCLSQITPASIIQAHRSGRWLNADACNAGRLFSAIVVTLNATQELFAAANATAWEAISCPDGGAPSPNWEPICLARKPLIGTVAANVLAHGTGALNVDGCRVGTDSRTYRARGMKSLVDQHAENDRPYTAGLPTRDEPEITVAGRWPANLLHDGSDEVMAAFPDRDGATSNGRKGERGVGNWGHGAMPQAPSFGDSGSAARFFYQASKDEPCTSESASDAALNLPPSKEAVVFALKLAAARSMPPKALRFTGFQALSTTDTASELRKVCETVTETMQIIAQRFSRGLPPQNISLRSNLAECAGRVEPTGIMTITASLWKSGGFADLATFNITQKSLGLGGAACEPRRFHYSSKADKGDRLGSKHPTVKPVDVMAWLTRLITPPGGVVLDPFAGSGTTGMACLREGFDAVLIEREAEYVADINRRLKHVKGEDAPLFEGTP
jgi:hypothetical protein